MKKVVMVFASLLVAFMAMAQQGQEGQRQGPDPKNQEKIKAARIAFITERLGLTPAEAEKFWPVYHEFSQKRMELKQQLDQRRNNPDPNKSQEQNEKEALEYGLQLRQKELDLEKEYSGKLLNVVPAQKIMALRKAEEDFRELVIKQLQHRQNMQQQRQEQRQRNEDRFRQRNNN